MNEKFNQNQNQIGYEPLKPSVTDESRIIVVPEDTTNPDAPSWEGVKLSKEAEDGGRRDLARRLKLGESIVPKDKIN